jgi:hypothetical protein
MSAKIRISSLHREFVAKCQIASKQLGFLNGRLPPWIALAIAEHLFSERLAKKMIRDLTQIKVLLQDETGFVRVRIIPEAQFQTQDGVPAMPDRWLQHLRVALEKNERFKSFADRSPIAGEEEDDNEE